MKRYLFLLCLTASPVFAMDHDPWYSYTRAELATGQVRHQSGSVQSVAMDGWIGGDKDRLWWQGDAAWAGGKSSGSGFGAWYGHYFAPFWDVQAGVRSEGNPGSANYLSLGVRGLAPYQYDTDIKLDIRSDGKWFAHGRFEQEVLLTNRFILRPWLDASFSGADIDNTVRKGLYRSEIGLQARYEFSRKFAPFAGISRIFHPRALPAGETDSTQLLAGIILKF